MLQLTSFKVRFLRLSDHHLLSCFAKNTIVWNNPSTTACNRHAITLLRWFSITITLLTVDWLELSWIRNPSSIRGWWKRPCYWSSISGGSTIAWLRMVPVLSLIINLRLLELDFRLKVLLWCSWLRRKFLCFYILFRIQNRWACIVKQTTGHGGVITNWRCLVLLWSCRCCLSYCSILSKLILN